MSPLKILSRGYGVVYGADKKVISDSAMVSVGDDIKIQLDVDEIYIKFHHLKYFLFPIKYDY